MSIARLTAHHVRIPLRRTVRHASHSRSQTDSIIVRCELDDGTVGWGEGLPREYVTGETIDDAWAILQSPHIPQQLSGRWENLAAAIERLNDFRALPYDASDLKSPLGDDCFGQVQPFIDRGCFGNSVRCAIELAFLDAVCRREGRPLSQVADLVPKAASIRQQISTVRYSGVITAMSPLAQVGSAFKQRIYGFRHVKVKVGIDGQDDVASLRRIRRILGRRADIRIDANEAWTCQELPERLGSLTPFHISSVEQPVPHADVGGLSTVREQLSVPVMLDESLCSLADGQRAIDNDFCELFNIRLSKCGGFLPSLRLAVLAHHAGLGYQLGCQVGETGILSAAGRHFATSISGIQYLEGSYDRHLVRERLTDEDLTFGYGGRAEALSDRGLGIKIDERALQRVSIADHHIM